MTSNNLNYEINDLFQKVLETISRYVCLMFDTRTIEFNGMPLFQKARFKSNYATQGKIEDFACFFYMTEGTMRSYDARGLHMINAKEAIMKHCGNYVQKYIADKETSECEAIAVYLYPNLLREIYKNEVPSFLKSEVEIPEPKQLIGNKLIEQYMNNLSVYFEAPDTLDEELGRLKLKELMMILLKSENHKSIRKLLSEIFAPVNVKFKEAVEKNLFNHLNIEQLAYICNMSLSTFKREFKKVFDDSPARYIKNRRLEQAASLLLINEDSISNIAFESGFQDLSTFSAIFQEKYNTSPSKYRLNHNRN
ncbi:MAG: helix-turn-helix transcriptional regulator [Reichenbachiella sp.]